MKEDLDVEALDDAFDDLDRTDEVLPRYPFLLDFRRNILSDGMF